MPARRLLPFLILLLLILPGCFRQAGEAFESPDTNSVQPTPEGVTPEDNIDSESAETLEPTSENQLPPVTIISPPTATETDEEIDTEGDGEETPESQDVGEPEEQPTLGGQVEEVVTPTVQVFITPGASLPITEIAPTQNSLSPSTTGGGGLPTATPSGLITPTALGDQQGDGCTYTIQPGNTLFSIARTNNIDLDALRAANPELVGDLIQVGQVLNIPGCGEGLDDQGNPIATAAPTGGTNASGQTVHTVAAGDTLVRIARQYNVTVQQIVSANNLANPNLLDVGQQLIIPTP